jgi:hypothetical protein
MNTSLTCKRCKQEFATQIAQVTTEYGDDSMCDPCVQKLYEDYKRKLEAELEQSKLKEKTKLRFAQNRIG